MPMSSLAELPELVGFFSYSRHDDAGSHGALSALRTHIQGELRGQLGRTTKTFRLWQDQEAIPSGTLWESEIKTAVAQSVFFIPIITPTVVKSPYCKFELESFLAREKELGRDDLVFPILYIDVPALEDNLRRQNDPVLSLIAKRQYVDWRKLRHRDIRTTEVSEAAERFCTHIRDALHRPWISQEERERQEAAQRQAEAEHRRREAAARRRAEKEARQRAIEEDRRQREVEAEQRRQAEAEAQRRAEEEAKERAADENRRQREAEAEQRRQAEAEAQRRIEEEAKERAADEDRRRRMAEAEEALARERAEEERRRRETAAERRRMAQEEAERRAEGRIKVEARIIHGAPNSWFKPGAGKVEWFQDHEHGPEMVVVPAGEFMMGSSEGKDDFLHRVRIAHPFSVGRHAVTRGQFAAFMNNTSYRMEGGAWVLTEKLSWKWTGRALTYEVENDPNASWRNPGFLQDDNHPVVCVHWDDVRAYVAWLSQLTGQTYRLLSEAEWEYVARAGTTTPFWWGSSITPAQANYDGNSVYEGGGAKGEWRKATVPVGHFEANPWGLYNVHGNVWEWCEDTWHDSYEGAPVDGSAWIQDGGPYRVQRGGPWYRQPSFLRSAMRWAGPTDYRTSFVGFRVGRTLTP